MKHNKFNLKDLLQEMPDEKVSTGFKANVMHQIAGLPQTAPARNQLLPERYLLFFSLFVGLLTLILLADFEFVSQYLLQFAQFFGGWIQTEQKALPAFLEMIGNLPALSLAFIPAILALFALERLMHIRFFSKNASLI
ncbi:MAG: hypothetical protein PHG67_05610 [Bacteroidales bacterium]|jgi:hypothetical protein|nr:hypothetical protein [Bacteroidales bacterium]